MCADSLGSLSPTVKLDNSKPSHAACPIPPLEKPWQRLRPHVSLSSHLLAHPRASPGSGYVSSCQAAGIRSISPSRWSLLHLYISPHLMKTHSRYIFKCNFQKPLPSSPQNTRVLARILPFKSEEPQGRHPC